MAKAAPNGERLAGDKDSSRYGPTSAHGGPLPHRPPAAAVRKAIASGRGPDRAGYAAHDLRRPSAGYRLLAESSSAETRGRRDATPDPRVRPARDQLPGAEPDEAETAGLIAALLVVLAAACAAFGAGRPLQAESLVSEPRNMSGGTVRTYTVSLEGMVYRPGG